MIDNRKKPQDPDFKAERAARQQRKERVAEAREQELMNDIDNEIMAVRGDGGRWPFALGNFAGF